MSPTGRRFSPRSFFALALVLGGVFMMMRDRVAQPGTLPAFSGECDEALDPLCAAVLDRASARRGVGGQAPGDGFTAPTVQVEEACVRAGYLCSGLDQLEYIGIRRWKSQEGTIVVHVPLPTSESAGDARRLQNAAAAGIRAWNEQPFPVSVDERGNREAHFSVRWSSSLGGRRIGLARTQWSPDTGLEVIELQLATRSTFRQNQVIDPRQVRLTAAHEMGHALGILMHSDSERDVMYPTNTATSLSAQDYRTMEVLYSLADGTRIIR
jgi:predicted Zn-dependent protease